MNTVFKRIVVSLLFTSIMFLCCACTNAGREHLLEMENSKAKNFPAATTEPVSTNPLIAAELQRAPVYNGSRTDILGFYAWIHIEKTTLKQITVEEYTEFCETVVDNANYNWVSIICDDWTGIQFTGSQYTIATYGKINYEGVITQDIGCIKQTEDGFIYEECQ